MTAWLDSARDVPVATVARQLGMDARPDSRSFGPCPACGLATRANPGRTDRRGRCRIWSNGLGWSCCSNGTDGCGASGDGVSLVAWVVNGGTWAPGDGEAGCRIRAWFAEQGFCAQVHGGRPSLPRTAPPPTRPVVPLTRPNAGEVADLWHRCLPVTDVAEVADWLRGRGFDAGAVAAFGLARALPRGQLPAWAWFKGRSWIDTGHRLVVRAWEPDPGRPGRLRHASLHARCVRPCEPSEKAAWPARCSAAGLLMAQSDDPLREGLERRLVTVCEGVPDWLALALQPPTCRGALLGAWCGSAQAATGDLLPREWTVAVATHRDDGGEAQARVWRREAERRGCNFKRCPPRRPEKKH